MIIKEIFLINNSSNIVIQSLLILYSNINGVPSRKNHDTFKNFLPYYLYPLKKPLLKFLKEISHNKQLLLKVSKEIFLFYSKSLQSIDIKILPYLTITTEITRYIQKTGLHDKSFKLFHQEKMSKLSKEIYSNQYLKNSSHKISEGKTQKNLSILQSKVMILLIITLQEYSSLV